MGTVWVVGSLNVDEIVRVERHPGPGETVIGGAMERRFGGKGANQAVAAACAGAAVRMIGRVGDDASGRAYRSRLEAFGIDVAGLGLDDALPTGRAAITVDAAGENAIVVSPGANGSVGAADLERLDAIGPADVLLVQLEVPRATVEAAVRRAAAAGARVVLNIAPFAPLPDDVLAIADPIVANESEAAELGAEPPNLLVTRGADGSSWGATALPASPVDRVVDTTGAGDTYCGALAAALARGEDPAAAMRSAADAAAASVGRAGAQPEPA